MVVWINRHTHTRQSENEMKKSINEIANELGELADNIDNIISATNLPMPPEFHLNQIKQNMHDWSKEIKKIYVELTDENPWQ
jgi:ElaB/YqjD/DUF883 family membrane-anchored ribosome-binding protein